MDRWIISRLNNLIEKVARNLDRYNVSVATLAIEKFFIDDLSLWYIRRSRKRFHPGHKERKEAIETLYYVLLSLTKIIAPITPFFAEEMYSNLRSEDMPESVHLCDWPKVEKEKIDEDLEEKMVAVRDIVTKVLSERAAAGIRVRQPLNKLRIKDKKLKDEKELLELMKEEVNVKRIVFDSKIRKEIELDSKITDELREEGKYREMVRHVNLMRKEMGLTPKDAIIIDSTTSVANLEDFKKETGAEVFNTKEKDKIEGDMKKEIKVDGEKHYIGIKK